MNRTLSLTLLLALAACGTPGSGGGGGGGGAVKADLSNDDSKTYYALGISMGQNLSRGPLSGITPDQAADVEAGVGDALNNRTPQVDMAVYGPKIQDMMKARQGQANAGRAAAAADEKKKGDAYAETAAKESGAQKLPSGLVFKELKAGTGAVPAPTDNVKVNYEGKLIDGTVFDASEKHGGPATFQLNRVIPCWTEGVQKLKVGGKAQLVCPSSIAYGDNGHPPTIPGGATLVFTVELLDIVPPTAPSLPGGPPGGRPMPPGRAMMHGPGGAPPPGGLQMHPMPQQPAAPQNH